MSGPVDLRQLAVSREQPAGVTPRRHIVTRYLIPGAVLLGFLALAGYAARDSFLPSRPVTVVPVLASRAEVHQEGTPLFQSAGWVEPRPTPVLVTALAEGVVEKLLVVEGQEVKAGEPVAHLIEADAKLALDAAQADLKLREAEIDTLVAKAETDLKFIPFQIQAAEARHQLARIDLENKKGAKEVIQPLALNKAESDLAIAAAALSELKLRKERLEREAVSLKKLRDAKEFKTEEPLTEVEANMKAALVRVRQAQVAVDAAMLRLERMTVRAPIAGRVLALIGRPGMGLAPSSSHGSGTLVTIYDPKMLQVRADVRFEDLPGIQPGQPVRIETPAVPGSLAGEVLFATSIADIQKNTLQVKVKVNEPPPILKPDMLVQVTFLAVAQPGSDKPSEQLRLLVPRQLVSSDANGTSVWVADQVGRAARLKPVKLGRMAGDLVEVEGLTAADKLISTGREGLRDGERITITGEDPAFGSVHDKGVKPKVLRNPHQGKH